MPEERLCVERKVPNSEKEKELLLIGTVHRDPDGVVKLRRLLARERPAAVAVEVSPYALSYRRRNGRRLRRRLMKRVKRLAEVLEVSWRRWGQIHAIQTQLRVPFEYRVAQKYCRDTGARLSCLDSSLWSKRWIHDQWQQLLKRENVAALLEQLPQDLGDEVQRGYQLAARLLRNREQFLLSVFARAWSNDSSWQQRETKMAGLLQQFYARMRKGRLAYVGGWQHLLGPNAGGTLYERIEHLQPRRVLLEAGTDRE